MYKHKFSKRVFPSERYVIQGILRPECKPKENRQKLKRCRTQAPCKKRKLSFVLPATSKTSTLATV